MPPTQTKLPLDLYPSPPISIGSCKATYHQFDCLAAFYHTRSIQQAAGLLGLSSKGISSHLRNFRTDKNTEINKISEGILQFLDACDKGTRDLLELHYRRLLAEKNFKNILKKIENLVTLKKVFCVLQFSNFPIFKKQLETHLKLAGICVSHLEETSNVDYILKLVTKNKAPPNLSENKTSYQIEIVQNTDVSPKNKEPVTVKFNLKDKYYLSVFEILRVFFPNLKLQPYIDEFIKKQKEILDGVDVERIERVFKKHEVNRYFSLLKEKALLVALIGIFIGGAGIASFYNTPVDKQDMSFIRFPLTLPSNNKLISRDKILKVMHQLFEKNSKNIKIISLVGPPGSGKNTLAQLYAKNHKGLFWIINAETFNNILQSFKGLAYALATTSNHHDQLELIKSIPNQKNKKMKYLAFIKQRLQEVDNWLLVYRNVENPADIKESLPQGEGTDWGIGKIIITSSKNEEIKEHLQVSPKNIIFIPPINYGEGDKKLQVIEPKKEIVPLNPSNPDVDSSYITNINTFRTDHFIGRSKESTTLEIFLKQSRHVSIVGISGIGKTRLSNDFAIKKLQEGAFVWNFDMKQSLKDQVYDLAKILVSEEKLSEKYLFVSENDTWVLKKILESLSEYYSEIYILLDDAQNTDFAGNLISTILEFSHTYVIITSQQKVGWKSFLYLQPLTQEESFDYLEKNLDKNKHYELAKLAHVLQGFPIALKQTVGYLNNTNVVNIKSYLKKSFERLKKTSKSEICSLSDTAEKSLDLVLDKIHKKSKIALELLQFLCELYNKNISHIYVNAYAEFKGIKNIEEAIQILENQGVIEIVERNKDSIYAVNGIVARCLSWDKLGKV